MRQASVDLPSLVPASEIAILVWLVSSGKQNKNEKLVLHYNDNQRHIARCYSSVKFQLFQDARESKVGLHHGDKRGIIFKI